MPPRTLLKIALVPSLFATLANCGPMLIDYDAGTDAHQEAATNTPPPPPTLRSLPDTTPYSVVSVQGTALNAVRVFVTGGENPVPKDVIPGGGFCVDVVLPSDGSYTFEVVSQDANGLLSSATVAMVVRDSNAAGSGDATCSGVDPATCDDRGVCGGPSTCTPNCAGRACGSDGCTGTCGSCSTGQTCNSSGQCQSGTGTLCGANNTCGACTAAAGCGWCSSSGACLAGSSSMSTDATCWGTAWVSSASACP